MRGVVWTFGVLYLIGFALVFSMEVAVGPVTPGLALLRAIVWPLYIATGIPKGERSRMD